MHKLEILAFFVVVKKLKILSSQDGGMIVEFSKMLYIVDVFDC
jgi:hypothetical protein